MTTKIFIDIPMNKSGSLLGGTLLVAGTCIGGGILALPVLTSMGGFIPSLVLYAICWAFMACTGLLYLEAAHWMDGESNIISMAEKTLGKYGKSFAWAVYLFFFYCLTVAYVVGCGDLVTQILPIPKWAGSVVFVAIFSPFVFAGAQSVGRFNIILMFGLTVSYLALVLMGYKFVDSELLQEKNWSLSIMALPVVFAAFGYQGIIPTLTTYMQHDIRKTRLAILIGSFLPFIAYVIWQWLILGIVPAYGEGGLVEAMTQGENAVQPLKNILNNPNIYITGQFFAFFALVTSFIGVTLGLQDFLADGLKIDKTHQGKFFLSSIVFLPPLAIAIVNPGIFLKALDIAGGFGSALLLGLLPILMVWSGRYRLKLPSHITLPGGRLLLVILIAFVIFEIAFELKHIFFG